MIATIARRFRRLLVCVLALSGGNVSADPLPVQSVPQVDLERYSGKWYEIAAFPMFFQRKCIGMPRRSTTCGRMATSKSSTVAGPKTDSTRRLERPPQ